MKGIVLLLLFLVFIVSAGNAQRKPNILTNEDKAEIIKETLNDSELLKDDAFRRKNRGIIYLSQKNIASVKLPKIEGLNLIFISRKQIKEKTKKGICYGEFEQFINEGSEVKVKFGMYCKRISFYAGVSYSANSFHTFTRLRGEWIGGQWIP